MREQIRWSLLRFLDATPADETSESLLARYVKNEGWPNLKNEIVAAELRYLADKGLVAPVERVISPENRAWRVTAAGRDFYAKKFRD